MIWIDFHVSETLLLNSTRLPKGLSSTKLNHHRSGSKSFWKISKPMFSNNVNNIEERLILVENYVSDERKIAQVFNLYISSGITQSLGIYHWGENCVQT